METARFVPGNVDKQVCCYSGLPRSSLVFVALAPYSRGYDIMCHRLKDRQDVSYVVSLSFPSLFPFLSLPSISLSFYSIASDIVHVCVCVCECSQWRSGLVQTPRETWQICCMSSMFQSNPAPDFWNPARPKNNRITLKWLPSNINHPSTVS